MAAGGRCPRRRSWIRRRRGDSKLGGHGGGNDDPVLTPGGRSHCRDWRCVRGHRSRLQGRMRVAANGDVYVPDSENEESDMEVGGSDVAVSGGATATVDGIAVGGDKDTVDAVDVVDVVAESIPADAVKVAAERGDTDGIKVAVGAASGEKMHPEVVARLEKLLPHIDPSFRDIFVTHVKGFGACLL
ncbi:unnamed protein product [Urochloa decumbens]|uniref:Uncharacterized protein n=1 Tax=Urochloa decumbens TaxID=240449 RepID=A0ABC9C455_9POAL